MPDPIFSQYLLPDGRLVIVRRVKPDGFELTEFHSLPDGAARTLVTAMNVKPPPPGVARRLLGEGFTRLETSEANTQPLSAQAFRDIVEEVQAGTIYPGLPE